MSRAFVKENDGDSADDVPDRPLSPHPNYITSAGLARQQQALTEALAAQAALDMNAVGAVQARSHLARDIRWLQARLAAAIPVPATTSTPERVSFGCRVHVQDQNGHITSYRLVGEDEARPEAGDISWVSPLARALTGRTVGDEVLWPRPVGDCLVEILQIEAGE